MYTGIILDVFKNNELELKICCLNSVIIIKFIKRREK